MHTPLTQLLNIDHPLIQAPMAGGATTADLVAAASEAGALGSLGAAYLTPAQITQAAAEVRARTGRPFAINLFAAVPATLSGGDTARMVELVAHHCEALGIEPPAVPTAPADTLPGQIDAVLRARPAVFSFTFGLMPDEVLARCRAAGILTVGTATTVREARTLAQAGVDAVVAQGAEAGGHRGSFLDDFEASLIGTMALVPQIVDAIDVPVIASGGIMDGRGVAAALALGAQAAQLGTAFLATDEAGIPDIYKDALSDTPGERTRVTRAFSGRPARGITNRFMDEADALAEDILPYPLQNALTRPMRTAAARQADISRLSLWAGQAAALARRDATRALVQRLAYETAATLARLTG